MKLTKYDFFRHVPEDLKVHTFSGSFFSLLSFVTMGMLCIIHWNAYREHNTKTTVVMDEHQEDRLRVNFNVSLLNVPCAVASVDLEDHMGQRFTNLTRHIRHWRLAVDKTTNGVQRMDEVVIDNHEKGIPIWGGVHRNTEGTNVHYSTQLNSKTFDDFMAKYELVLVSFYAPWCPFCQQLHPEWERAAAQLSDHPEYSEMVRMASVDCTDPGAMPICRLAHIRAFPSVLIYMYGSTSTRFLYNGPRKTEHLLLFLDLFFRRLEPDADFAEEVNVNKDTLGLPLPMRVNEKNLEGIDFKKRLSNIVQTDSVEGCEISGSISVNRVPGVLVFTARSDDVSFNVQAIDVSHTVNHFSFGQVRRTENLFTGGIDVLAAPSNRYPLDKTVYIIESEKTTVEHFLNVVGFDSPDSFMMTHLLQRSYEFSATTTQYTDKQPSALFKFDISPLVVQVMTDNIPFYHFVTHLCAVIGGVFTILGLVDSGVFHAMNSLKKKQQIGKLS